MLRAHSFCACIFHSNPLYSCLGAASDWNKTKQNKKKISELFWLLSQENFKIEYFFLIESLTTKWNLCFVFQISTFPKAYNNFPIGIPQFSFTTTVIQTAFCTDMKYWDTFIIQKALAILKSVLYSKVEIRFSCPFPYILPPLHPHPEEIYLNSWADSGCESNMCQSGLLDGISH